MGQTARSEAKDGSRIRPRPRRARSGEVRGRRGGRVDRLARALGLRAWTSVCLLALLPFTASCNLQELGLSLKTLARGLGDAGQSTAGVAGLEVRFAQNDVADAALRQEIVHYLRRYPTGLSRIEEVNLADGILQASRESGLDHRMLMALMRVESRCSNWAISPKGAMGLMQLMPATGRRMARELSLPWAGSASLFDPVTNVQIAARYLSKLRGRYGDMGLALMAYNRGPGALESGEPLDPNQDGYVTKVLSQYQRLIRQSGVAHADRGKSAPSA